MFLLNLMSKVNKIVKAIEVKTIFLGESGVGKTNLIKAAIDEEFDEATKSTSMASCVEKSVKVDKKYYLLLSIYTVSFGKYISNFSLAISSIYSTEFIFSFVLINDSR